MKRIIIILISTLCAANECHTQTHPVLMQVVECVKTNHIAPRELDEHLPMEIVGHFLSNIDPEQLLFTQLEINILHQKAKALADEFCAGRDLFWELTFEMLRKGIAEAELYAKEAMRGKMNLFKNDYFETEPSKRGYAPTKKALKKRWAAYFKKRVLDEILALEYKALPFEQTKAEAILFVGQSIQKELDVLRNLDANTILPKYINAFLKTHDVQTEFLTVEEKAKWDEAFTRNLVGIGVELNLVNGYPCIAELNIGGPAWKSKLLEKGDLLLKISNAEQTMTDVVGAPMEDVLHLLKGEQNTHVKLLVKKRDNRIVEVALLRDKIELERAVSFILKDMNGGKEVGYIKLPRFYEGETTSAEDVLKEINILKNSNIDGIILDLRGNQGGSAREAIKLMGYFLEGGVVMRAHFQNGNQRTYEDPDSIAQYKGKLVVLVDHESASASELFSGTMQDYGRAVVVGSQATFGKGTIQRFFNIEDSGHILGHIKMTVGSFFTASGRSIQYKGIVPDIVLPHALQLLTTGERTFGNSAKIADLDYFKVTQNVNSCPNVAVAKQLSIKRIEENATFGQINEMANSIKQHKDGTLVNLNYGKYRLYKSQWKEIVKEKVAPNTECLATPTLPAAPESAAAFKNEHWRDKIEKDAYIFECYQIMCDLLIS